MSPAVALIGSSGGGTATLGHTDAVELLRIVHQELLKVQDSRGIVHALFCSLEGKGFDAANQDVDTSTLYLVEEGDDWHVQAVKTGILKDVNKNCQKLDLQLAAAIQRGEIQGLICISCNIELHQASLKAAAFAKIPVTGSGGTSLSAACISYPGLRLVGNAGGSVATTSYTRAVSYTHALATAWNRKYDVFSDSATQQLPQWTSVLNACLPAFWAVMLACRAIESVSPVLNDDASSWLDENNVLVLLQNRALPTVCCVIMATSLAPKHESTAIMAACVASVVCERSILAGLLCGFLVAKSISRILHQCILWNIPATMTNLIIAGGIGAIVAILVAPLVPWLQQMTEWIRYAIHLSMNGTCPGVGFVIGILFCWGSKVGYYHAIGLPIILVEMELGQPSLWGAIDEATLVLVSAGICFGNLLIPSGSSTDRALCRRGLRINLWYGDFIEVAYPFMEKSAVINACVYIASGLATELLTGDSRKKLSSAYLPLPLSIWLAIDRRKIALAYGAAFGVSFVGAIVGNVLSGRKRLTKKDKKS